MSETTEIVLKVVEADALELETATGWQLKQVLSETAVEVHRDTVPNPHPDPNNGCYYVNTIDTETHFEFRKHRYLLERTGDSILEEAAYRVKAAVQALKEVREEMEALRNELKAAREAHACSQSNYERSTDTIETLKDEVNQCNASKNAMETDIAAIRIAVGEREVKRILEEAHG